MSDCDWCEGKGCDECKPKAKKGAAKKGGAAPKKAPACDWCDDKGCDECKPKAKKAPAKGAASSSSSSGSSGSKSARANCKICEGLGCEACETQTSKPAKKETKPAKKPKCKECGGAGCFECENPEEEEESGTGGKSGKGDEGGDDECWTCGGEGCDDCGKKKKPKGKKEKEEKKGKPGKCDFCSGEGCPACQDNPEADSPEIMLENSFYEAEDVKRAGKPADIITAYRKVLDLGSGIKKPSDDIHSKIFKSMEMICISKFHLKKDTEFKTDFRRLIEYTPKVTPDEGNHSIDEVLNSVSSDLKTQEEVFDITREEMKKLKDTDRSLFRVNMKQVNVYMDKKAYRQAETLLNRVHISCRLPDGTDDAKTRAADLVDIYAQKITIQLALGNALALKDLERRTRPLLQAVVSAKSQSILRECFGKMYGDDGDWSTAKAEFFGAFTGFLSAGANEPAKNNLKYCVIAGMLDSKDAKNLFESREAKAFEKEPDVAAIASLRRAFEKNDVEGFIGASTEIQRSADPFILKHLDSMIRDFQGKAIVQLCKPYRRVKLDFIARSLKIDLPQVENLLIQLILDNELGGVIDQVKGLLDLTATTGGGAKKYNAIDQWAGHLLRITDSLEQPMV